MDRIARRPEGSSINRSWRWSYSPTHYMAFAKGREMEFWKQSANNYQHGKHGETASNPKTSKYETYESISE